jgi:tRNA1Val (adenine37-N6)-methyltransferase
MLAWRFPHARFVGVEAQPEHVSLARRNVLLNGCESRAIVVAADLRDDPLGVEDLGPFDLVTATPPYFDPRAATVCSDPQRAHAQWELRGGIEDYALAASRVLSSDGRFVTCSAATPEDRTPQALTRAGLHPIWHREVLPRLGKPAFLSLWIAARNAIDAVVQPPPLVLRQLDGARTPEHIEIREWFGIPCSFR